MLVDTERQPLLPKAKDTPLPRRQLGIICFLRLAEPLLFQNIFAYVCRMVEVLKITDNLADVGWYSGLIESSFAVAQLTMIYNWAKLSDRIGRKPCVLFTTTGAATATLLFGLSTNLYTALFARIMAGLMAGNVAVVESMVGEITDESNQARAFTIVATVWYSGSILGTLLGGALSEPVARFPDVFGRFQLLADFPFFLPCLIAYCLAMISVITGLFWLEETLPRKQRQTDNTAAPPAQLLPDVSAWFLLKDPIVRSVLAPYLLLSIQCIGFEVLFTLFSYTPLSLGGLNRSSFEIGVALAFAGLVAVVIHPIAFPALSRRISLKRLYCGLMLIYPLCYLATPILNIVAGAMSPSGELTRAGNIIIWILIGVLLLTVRMGGMAFAAHTIFAKNAAPSGEALGSTFGLLHSFGATGRAVGPSLVSSLFAITASHNLLGGWFVWLFMAGIGCFALCLSARVRDGSQERRQIQQ